MQAFSNFGSNTFPSNYSLLNKVNDTTVQTVNCPDMTTCWPGYNSNLAAQVCMVCNRAFKACCDIAGCWPAGPQPTYQC